MGTTQSDFLNQVATARSRRLKDRACQVLCGVLVLLLAACGSDSEAGSNGELSGDGTEFSPVTLRYSSYLAEGDVTEQAMLWFADEVESRTDGAVQIEFFFNGTLLPIDDQAQGLADGRADVGLLNAAQYPAELPLSTGMGIPFITDSADAQALAMAEMFENSDELRGEFSNAGLMPIIWIPLGGSVMGFKEPSEGWDDLSGRRIRGIGLLNEAIEAAGGEAVALPAPEVYESLQRGLLDGFAATPFWLIGTTNFQEVAPHIKGMGIGPYSANFMAMNAEKFNQLEPKLRELLVEVGQGYGEQYAEVTATVEDEVCEKIVDGGGTITLVEEADAMAFAEQVRPELVDAWADSISVEEETARGFIDDYIEAAQRFEEATPPTGVQRCAENSGATS